jgi:hypothetical protein
MPAFLACSRNSRTVYCSRTCVGLVCLGLPCCDVVRRCLVRRVVARALGSAGLASTWACSVGGVARSPAFPLRSPVCPMLVMADSVRLRAVWPWSSSPPVAAPGGIVPAGSRARPARLVILRAARAGRRRVVVMLWRMVATLRLRSVRSRPGPEPSLPSARVCWEAGTWMRPIERISLTMARPRPRLAWIGPRISRRGRGRLRRGCSLLAVAMGTTSHETTISMAADLCVKPSVDPESASVRPQAAQPRTAVEAAMADGTGEPEREVRGRASRRPRERGGQLVGMGPLHAG